MDGISRMPVPSYKAVIVLSFIEKQQQKKKSKRKKNRGFSPILVRKLILFFLFCWGAEVERKSNKTSQIMGFFFNLRH